MDPIADMLTRIKNAQMVQAEQVLIPASKVRAKIASILKEAGFVEHVEKKKRKDRKVENDYLDLTLRYVDGRPAISGIRLMSRPSRHLYIQAKDIRPVRSGYGVAIISTPKGIMTSKIKSHV
ncbi:MAG: 30S ribosomal protein S8 [Candidatus Yanofskybacteria bacterium]|nr:30S ribosomal protein S8 [Candidatus Yanofskybacteria bacterium]